MSAPSLSPVRKLVVMTMLLAVVWTSPLAAGVLCLGADGHADLEWAIRDCCDPDQPSNCDVTSGQESPGTTPIMDSCSADDSCGECIDILLRHDAVRFDKRSSKSDPASAALLTLPPAPAHLLAPQPLLPKHGNAQGLRSGALALSRLQGVTLRC